MLAFLRPDEWEFPLFLHVLGAVVLFGGVVSTGFLTYASRPRAVAPALLLRRLAFRTVLIVVWPAYVLMRVAAEWIRSKEFSGGTEPDWVGVGYVIADAGLLILIALTVCTYLAARQTSPERPRPAMATVATALAGLYLVALAVAWWAMSTKPS